MSSPTDEIRWEVIGSLSRSWVKPDRPYFALLFAAPKNIRSFSIYQAAPLLSNFTAPEPGSAQGQTEAGPRPGEEADPQRDGDN